MILPAEWRNHYPKAEEGDAVEVGQVVCLIDTDGQPFEGDAPAKTEATPDEPVKEAPVSAPAATTTYATGTASPAAKKILNEKGIDPATIQGTGRDGRVTKQDAIDAVPSMGTPPAHGTRDTSRKKCPCCRRRVAERLVSAKNETAMLTTFNEANMSPIFALRNEYKEVFKEKRCRPWFYEFLHKSCSACFARVS